MTQGVGLRATVDCYCLAARRTARTITRVYEEYLRPHGLRATQFSILAALALKGPTAIGELAESLGLERTTLTRSTALLERKEWVRGVSISDARRHVLDVTAAGRRKLQEALPAWSAAQRVAGREILGINVVSTDRQDGGTLSAVPMRYPGRAGPDLAGWDSGCWRRSTTLLPPQPSERTAA